MIKIATHVVFDEANMKIPTSQLLPAAEALQKIGYCSDMDSNESSSNDTDSSLIDNMASIQFTLLSDRETAPPCSTEGAAGYDLNST